jgi:hypothetical protein
MPRMKYALVLVTVLLASGLALAQDEGPKWGYVEGGWIDFDPDDGVSDDGWFAGASFGLGKNFHLLAEYDDIGAYTFWNAGAGWHGLLGDKADLFAQVMWANIQVDEGDIDENGYDVEGGVRWRLIKWFELNGKVSWVDYGGDAGNDTTGQVGVLFYLGRIGIGANWETGDADTTRAFFRFNFGK